MSTGALAAVLVVGGVVAVGIWSLRRVLFAVVSDEGWARVEGLPVDTLGVALAALTAAVIVAGMKVVGLLLMAAMMVLPVASAQLLARSFRKTVWLAAVIGAASAFVGAVVGQLFDLSISGDDRAGRRGGLRRRESRPPIAPGRHRSERGMKTELDTTVEARLRGAGQRYTGQRRDLVRLLADAASPRSIPQILADAGDMKQSSAYRNLASLEHARRRAAGSHR